MRNRHIESAILNFEIPTSKTLEMAAFTLPPILKKLIHFGKVQVRKKYRGKGLSNFYFYDK